MKFVYIIIIFILINNVLNTCSFKNSSNTYYLSINETLNCKNDKSVRCEYLFTYQCPYSYEWIGHPYQQCTDYCCILTTYDYLNVTFVCTCPHSK